jgi:hypothetical protein
MALPSWLLIPVDGRRFQRPGPSLTLGSFGPSHHRRHKSQVSLRDPPCAHCIMGIPYGEVRDSQTPFSMIYNLGLWSTLTVFWLSFCYMVTIVLGYLLLGFWIYCYCYLCLVVVASHIINYSSTCSNTCQGFFIYLANKRRLSWGCLIHYKGLEGTTSNYVSLTWNMPGQWFRYLQFLLLQSRCPMQAE